MKADWDEITQGMPEVKEDFFEILVQHYSASGRYYHTMEHIQALLSYVHQYEELLNSPRNLKFAVWYHDVIYDPLRSDNEEKSAELAQDHLIQLGLDSMNVRRISELIIATAKHTCDPNEFDATFFLDIDLSILASNSELYDNYASQIRKEYQMYPDEQYNAGRLKVLEHFLGMDRIYKTDLFYEKWEGAARENLKREKMLL